jgi:hypothetical protein
MKNYIVFTLAIILISCSNNRLDRNLDEYLSEFGVNIKECKVVCIMPADGCMSCCKPSIDYSYQGSPGFVLVLTSNFQKSIDLLIERYPQIINSKIVMDSDNIAQKRRLVFITAPCIYFLKNGQIKKKIDLSETIDQTIVFKDVSEHLLNDSL